MDFDMTPEPGIHLPAVDGLRIKDARLVTASGLKALSYIARELVCHS